MCWNDSLGGDTFLCEHASLGLERLGWRNVVYTHDTVSPSMTATATATLAMTALQKKNPLIQKQPESIMWGEKNQEDAAEVNHLILMVLYGMQFFLTYCKKLSYLDSPFHFKSPLKLSLFFSFLKHLMSLPFCYCNYIIKVYKAFWVQFVCKMLYSAILWCCLKS